MDQPPAPPEEAASTPPVKQRGRAVRAAYFLLGLFLTGVGIAGYILPLLPGTVFLILAAACFARSSRRLEGWLLNHPRLGPGVRAWRANGAIPMKAKILAILAMSLSMAVLLLFSHAPAAVLLIAALFLGGSALFVGTRPGVKD